MSSNRPANIGTRDFTLLELLVAIMSLAILVAVIQRELDSTTRTREALTQYDERTGALKTAYAQSDVDCTQLADLNTLSHSPAEIDTNRVLMACDHRDDGQLPAWQVVFYRIVDGRLECPQTQPITNHGDLRSAMDNLCQGGVDVARYLLVANVNSIDARIRIESGSWTDSTDVLSAAPFPTGSNTTTLIDLPLASTPNASVSLVDSPGVVALVALVRMAEPALPVCIIPQGASQRSTRTRATGF